MITIENLEQEFEKIKDDYMLGTPSAITCMKLEDLYDKVIAHRKTLVALKVDKSFIDRLASLLTQVYELIEELNEYNV